GMLTAKQYFTGTLSGYSSPIALSCQRSFIMLATDGNPTSDPWGNMYPLSQQQSTYNASNQTWTYSQAANDVFGQITSLRTSAVDSFTHDIQTYVVGLGDTVANPQSIAVLNQFAALGGTNRASGRTILGYKPSAALGSRGIPFRWQASYPAAPGAAEMDLAQSSLLNADMSGVVDDFGSQRVQWIRGSASNEGATCPTCTPS